MHNTENKLTLFLMDLVQSRLELSRACFETGKFLSDPKIKHKELNGKPASYYLEKAKTMFEEMDPQWDLGEYRKFTKP
jgi:hypothetical protein